MMNSIIALFLFGYSEVLYKEENGRLSLAYERLPGIPKRIADQFATKIHTLDMSFNNIK